MPDTNPIAHLNKREAAVAFMFTMTVEAVPRTGIAALDRRMIRESCDIAAGALLALGCTPDELAAGVENARKVLAAR